MIVDAAGREVLGGGGVLPVDVRALGAELRRLWSAPGRAGSAPGQGLTRACTRNVIVLAPSVDAALDAGRRLADVAARYPTRAFVVRPDPAPDRLEATLEVHCLMRGGVRHVGCEQITLTVGARAGRRAASAIVPLLVPDLPVFVWATGTPRWDDELLDRLLDAADRLLFDSRACDDPVRLLIDVSGRGRSGTWSPADLEWARLADWREAVATLFDDPAGAPLPAHVARVAIRHGARGASSAALLAGWILDRLEAARAGTSPGRAARGAAAGAVPVELVLEPGTGPHAVERVRLEVARGPAVLEAERTPEGGALRLGIEAPEACALPGRVPCAAAPIARLLEAALAVPGRDPLYEAALARAAALLGGAAGGLAGPPGT